MMRMDGRQCSELPEGPPCGGPSFVHGPRGLESNQHLSAGRPAALPVECYVPCRGRRFGVKMGRVVRDAVGFLVSEAVVEFGAGGSTSRVAHCAVSTRVRFSVPDRGPRTALCVPRELRGGA